MMTMMRKMRLYGLMLIFMLLFALDWYMPCYALVTTSSPLVLTVTGYALTPDEYKITIHKIELYDVNKAKWITIGEGDMKFDIAAVNAGAMVGAYVSGRRIPDGTYTQVRLTVSRHIWIKAHIVVNGTSYYTNGTSLNVDIGGTTPNPITSVVAATNSALYNEGEVVTPSISSGVHYQVTGDYFVDTETLATPIVIDKDHSKRITVKFDVTNAVWFYDGGNSPPWGTTPFFYIGTAPSISITIG